MVVRKNFLFDENIAKYLKELSQDENTNMTAYLSGLIEKQYQKREKQKRLDAFYHMSQSVKEAGPNHFLANFDSNDHKIIQKIKALSE